MAPRAGENQSHLDSTGLVAVIGSRPWLLRTIKGHVLSADYYAYGRRTCAAAPNANDWLGRYEDAATDRSGS